MEKDTQKRNIIFCTQCGHKNATDHSFCVKCGAPLYKPDKKPVKAAAQNTAQDAVRVSEQISVESTPADSNAAAAEKTERTYSADTAEKPDCPYTDPKTEQPEKPQKKSRKGILIAAVVIALIAAIIVVILLVTGVLKKKEKISVSPIVEQTVSASSAALPLDINADDLSYSVGLQLIDRMKEKLNSEDFRKITEINEEYAEMIDAYSLPEKPSSIYKINVGFTDQINEELPEQLKELGVSDYDETAYRNNAAVNALTNAILAGNDTEDIEAYSEFNSFFGTSVNFVYDGLTDSCGLLFVQDGCDPVLVSYLPYDNGTVKAYANIITGAAGESITEDPNSIVSSLDEEWYEAEITELDDPETCKIPAGTQSESQNISDIAAQCAETVMKNGTVNLMLKSRILFLDLPEQRAVIDAFKNGDAEVQNISCVKVSDISDNIETIFSEQGHDISSFSEEVRTVFDNSIIDSIRYMIPQMTDSENAALDMSFSAYSFTSELYKGELLLEDGTAVDETVICIVNCGDDLPPIFLSITPDDETGVISARGYIAFGTTPDDCYQYVLHIDEVYKKLAEGSESNTEAEEKTEEQTAPAAVKADRVEFNDGYSGSSEIGTITAYAGSEVIWQKSTNAYPGAQLSQCGELGICNDMYYYYEGNSVYALNLADGSVVWQNQDLSGGSCTCVFDGSGNLILTGSLSMMLMGIDSSGNTLFLEHPGSDQYMWPTITGLEGNKVRMNVTTQTSSMQETSILVDLSDFSITQG